MDGRNQKIQSTYEELGWWSAAIIHPGKNGTSDALWVTWSVNSSPVCLNTLNLILFKPPTSLNCEPWPMSHLPEPWTPALGGEGHMRDDVEVCSGFYQLGAAFSTSLALCVYVGKLGLSQGLKLRLRGCPAHMFTQHGVEEFTWQAVSRFWSRNRKSEPQAGLQRARPPNSSLCHPPLSEAPQEPTFIWEQSLSSVVVVSARDGQSQEVGMGGNYVSLAQTGTLLKRSKGRVRGCMKCAAAADQSCLFCSSIAGSRTHNRAPTDVYQLPPPL